MRRVFLSAAIFAATTSLGGCIMQPVKGGYMIGLDTESLLAKQKATIETPMGTMKLRYTTSGRHELKFEDKGQIYGLGDVSDARVESYRQVGDAMLVLLRLTSSSCVSYRAVEIRKDDLFEYDVRPDCSTASTSYWQGDRLFIEEGVRNNQLNYWVWTGDQMLRQHVAIRPTAPTPAPATRQVPATAANSSTSSSNTSARTYTPPPLRHHAPTVDTRAVPALHGKVTPGAPIARVRVTLTDG